jgi:nitrite reductase (cytochrome c-552)
MSILDRFVDLRGRAVRALACIHFEGGAAWEAGAEDQEMEPVLRVIRSAQWRWDFVAASHGAAAHAPVESGRLLGTAIDISGEARTRLSPILSRLGVEQPVPMPEWEKATLQAYIGMDMGAERARKQAFIRDTLPRWYAAAAHVQPGPTDHVPRFEPDR